MSERNEALRERRPRTPEQAREALQRLINAAWHRSAAPSAFTIPADPERDADLILGDVIEEWVRLRDGAGDGR